MFTEHHSYQMSFPTAEEALSFLGVLGYTKTHHKGIVKRWYNSDLYNDFGERTFSTADSTLVPNEDGLIIMNFFNYND